MSDDFNLDVRLEGIVRKIGTSTIDSNDISFISLLSDEQWGKLNKMLNDYPIKASATSWFQIAEETRHQVISNQKKSSQAKMTILERWLIILNSTKGTRNFPASVGEELMYLAPIESEVIKTSLLSFDLSKQLNCITSMNPEKTSFTLEKIHRALMNLYARNGEDIAWIADQLIHGIEQRKQGFHKELLTLLAKEFDPSSIVVTKLKVEVWWPNGITNETTNWRTISDYYKILVDSEFLDMPEEAIDNLLKGLGNGLDHKVALKLLKANLTNPKKQIQIENIIDTIKRLPDYQIRFDLFELLTSMPITDRNRSIKPFFWKAVKVCADLCQSRSKMKPFVIKFISDHEVGEFQGYWSDILVDLGSLLGLNHQYYWWVLEQVKNKKEAK